MVPAGEAAAAAEGRNLDQLQLHVEGRLGIPREVYAAVRWPALVPAQLAWEWLLLLGRERGKGRRPWCTHCVCLRLSLQAGGVRVRQHVNPLKRELQVGLPAACCCFLLPSPAPLQPLHCQQPF